MPISSGYGSWPLTHWNKKYRTRNNAHKDTTDRNANFNNYESVHGWDDSFGSTHKQMQRIKVYKKNALSSHNGSPEEDTKSSADSSFIFTYNEEYTNPDKPVSIISESIVSNDDPEFKLMQSSSYSPPSVVFPQLLTPNKYRRAHRYDKDSPKRQNYDVSISSSRCTAQNEIRRKGKLKETQCRPGPDGYRPTTSMKNERASYLVRNEGYINDDEMKTNGSKPREAKADLKVSNHLDQNNHLMSSNVGGKIIQLPPRSKIEIKGRENRDRNNNAKCGYKPETKDNRSTYLLRNESYINANEYESHRKISQKQTTALPIIKIFDPNDRFVCSTIEHATERQHTHYKISPLTRNESYINHNERKVSARELKSTFPDHFHGRADSGEGIWPGDESTDQPEVGHIERKISSAQSTRFSKNFHKHNDVGYDISASPTLKRNESYLNETEYHKRFSVLAHQLIRNDYYLNEEQLLNVRSKSYKANELHGTMVQSSGSTKYSVDLSHRNDKEQIYHKPPIRNKTFTKIESSHQLA